jgi:hypothetical protein
MKRASFTFVALFALLLPVFALAQAAGAPVVADPTLDQLLSQGLGVTSVWKASGAVAGLMAAVNLTVNLTKYPPIYRLLGYRFWLRPAFSIVAGFLLALLGALGTGSSIPAAILAGIVAGLSNVGVHELYTSAFNPRISAERAAGARVVEAIQRVDAEMAAQVEKVKTQLDSIAAIPGAKERLEALAAWANTHPPKADA